MSNPVFRSSDGAPLYTFTLTARGRPLGEGINGVMRFLDLGHEWVVRGFASMTTEAMHMEWGEQMTARLESLVPECMLSDSDWEASAITTALPPTGTLTGGSGERTYYIPCDGVSLEVTSEGELPPSFYPICESLAALLCLEEGWDSYGGRRIDPACVEAALNLALCTMRDDTPVPSVVPTSKGCVQLEWHVGGLDLEVEFLSPTRIVAFFVDSEKGEEWEEDVSFDQQPLVDSLQKLSERSKAWDHAE